MNFLHFAVILIVISVGVVVIVSLSPAAPNKQRISAVLHYVLLKSSLN
jgi:hypothetical protein